MSLVFRDRLIGGNRTSVGDSQDVINELERSGERLNEIYSLFFDEDPVVVMRSSYVAMKYAEINPQSVAPFKQFLLENLIKFRQQELRWHIPQLFNYIVLSGDEVDKAYLTFMEWAEKDKSKIVAYYSLQTAANIIELYPGLRKDFLPRLQKLSMSYSKSVQNRCKKIAKQLNIDL